MAALTLSELNIYPIKSAAGIALSSVQLTSRGLANDRRWMVADPDGKFLTQRRFPKMALIQVAVDTDRGELHVSTPGMPDLTLPLTLESGPQIEVEVWGDRTTAIATSPEVGEWFSQCLATPCQLAYMPESAQRPTAHGKLGSDTLVSFADAYPFLLVSEASLAGLNEKLAEPVPMNRFRPNLVISGCDRPHEEDRWQRLRIGEAIFTVAKPCDRCSIPTVDQATGIRGKEPMKTLATYRYWDKGIWFGQNLVQESAGTLHLGDEVEILA